MASVVGTAAMGQTLLWTQRVQQPVAATGFHNAEVALGVNRIGTDVMVAWIHFKGDDVNPNYIDSDIWYNVSVGGEQFDQSLAARIPRVPPNIHAPNTADGGDPMVAFSRSDGTGWVGGVDNHLQDSFWVCRKDAAQQTAQPASEAVFPFPNDGVDKGLLVAGPPVGGGSDRVSLVFCRAFYENRQCSGFTALKRLRGITSPDLGATWIEENQFAVGPDLPPPPNAQIHNGNRGGCGTPLILHNGLSASRWVVAYRPEPETIYPGCTSPPPPLPLITWTDNTEWHNSVGPTRATIPGSTDSEPIFGIDPNLLGLGGIQTVTFPSMAAYPADESTIYMVFSGHAPSSDVGYGPFGNADLFVARSTDGGNNFSGNPVGSQVLHLTDQQLGELPGSHQIMAALTVDQFAGVNIIYYTAIQPTDSLPPVWVYQVKYARITGFGTAQQSIVHFPLADPFTLEGVTGLLPPFPAGNPRFLGDYVMGDSRGCDVYFGFPSRDGTGGISVYVSKIRVCPIVVADVNADGAVNGADVLQFAGDYVAGAPPADVNHDSVITLDDANLFLQSYACGCNPP